MQNSSLRRLASTANTRILQKVTTKIPPRVGPTTRSRVLLLFLLLFGGFHWACQSRTVDVKQELQKYLDEATQWVATEEQINTAVATVRQDQFVHDELVLATLKPLVTITRDYVQKLEYYQPRTPPLINVHREYIEAWRAHYFSITAIVAAVEKKDYIQLAKANADLAEAQRSVADALTDLARLLREAGLRQDSPSEEPQRSPAPQSAEES